MTAKLPASIRNNNPGAMEPGPVSARFGSTSHQVLNWTDEQGRKQVNKIATFESPIQGAAAQFALLASKTYAGLTLSQAIAKWCGSFGLTSYIKAIESSGLVTRDTVLTRDLLLNKAIAIPLAKSMAWQEAGMDFPMSDADWKAAHAVAFAGAAVPAAATPAKAANAAPAVPAPAAPATTVAAPPAASPTATPAPAPHSISDVVVILNATAGSLGKSWTLRGAALAVLGFISDLYEGALSIGLEAVSAMQQLKPLEGAIGNIAGNTKAISASMFFFGIGVIGTRRIKAKLEGRKG